MRNETKWAFPPAVLTALVLASHGCGPQLVFHNRPDGGPSPGAACAAPDAPAECGRLCTAASADGCSAGLYCLQGTCAADCSASLSCGDGARCDAKGQCQPAVVPDDPNGQACAELKVEAAAVPPTVLLLLDQSGSMGERFGSTNRMAALKSSLIDPKDGVVSQLKERVRFGMSLYTSLNGDQTPPCPQLTSVSAALNNFDAISSQLSPAKPRDDTPTGDAVRAVFPGLAQDPSPGAKIIVLATDGEPDSCADPDPSSSSARDAAKALSVTAVKEAFAAGVRTYVLSVGSDIAKPHLQDLANAGSGVANNAAYWEASNPDGLKDALQQIVRGALSCQLRLQGELQSLDRACSGKVKLDGRVLTCDDPNGWSAVDVRHIELKGTACTEFLQGKAQLEAFFPCQALLN